MSAISLTGMKLTTQLKTMLLADDITPGAQASYQLCKTIYAYHPLGAKMAESPIAMAQSQEREIAVPDSPEERVKKAFLDEWAAIGADKHIFNVMRLSRAYGVASIALLSKGTPANRAVDFKALYKSTISFNVFDPLNTAGSLVLNQDPNAMDFQKVAGISVQGTEYHRSRCVVMMNEDPLYIEYTTSAFGYVGRSVYQRALFPLKSFVQTMVTDDMVTRKAGVLVAKLKQAGSIINNLMSSFAGQKRQLLKEAETDNVLSISAGDDEEVESLNLQNVNEAMTTSRRNILENIAVSADMPAQLLNSETFAEGFGEGTEDAKAVARYIDRVRVAMKPLYEFFDQVVMYRAWNPEFYATIQAEYPEYQDIGYTEAFYRWCNSFTAQWPSLLTEPDSEKIKVDDVRLKAVIAMLEVLLPNLDPENRTTAIAWAADNFNELKLMFQSPLFLDLDALAEFVPPVPGAGNLDSDSDEEDEGAKRPPVGSKARADGISRVSRALKAYDDAVARLDARKPLRRAGSATVVQMTRRKSA